jgi:hypothetical protein
LQAIEKLANDLGTTRLVVLEYHIRDEFATPESEALFQNYGARATPSVYFDGGRAVLGGGDTQYLYNSYLARINTELTGTSSFSIAASSIPNSNVVNARLTNNSSEAINDAQLVGVATQDLGTAGHHFIVRNMTSTGVNLAPGQTQDYQISLEMSGQVVVFVKNSSGSIIQAALVS